MLEFPPRVCALWKNSMGLRLLLTVLVLLLSIQDSAGACAGSTCAECISSGYSCAWCSMKNFTAPRCQPKSKLEQAGCDNLENPKTSTTYESDEPVRNGEIGNPTAVQLQPQRIKIKTRTFKEHTISLTFRAANNYPVDIYFLFDNSLSMAPQIKDLAKLASDIGQSIGEISTNYRIGYGIFQDKVIMPFTDTAPEKLKSPCPKRDCIPPFEYMHLLDMTNNIKSFRDKVNETRMSGNLDHPEGSLDAIMQAVSCSEKIGWRTIGRKLLIMASNDKFHLAGDGKLAGIVTPNDGQCHLDGSGLYTKELQQDYPSVSQITEIVRKKEVHIIFAVTQEQTDLFQALSNRIPNSVVKLLASSDDESNKNIKDIIEQKYREMIAEVEMVHNKLQGVEVSIKSKSSVCGNTRGTNVCKGIEIGQPVKFDVEVKVTECPTDPNDRKRELIIHPNSLKSDQLVLEIETICECDCLENASTWEINSEVCSGGNGTLKCGLCDCNENRFGQLCECDSTNLDSFISGCRNPQLNSSTVCSGAGKCECGKCKCNPGYSETYCECNDQDCDIGFNREVCGGSSRGKCVCSECICNSAYTGKACDCPVSNTTCIYEGTLCNDVGTCICGKCRDCKTGYKGEFCQDCFLCSDSVCDIETYRKCAECAFNKKPSECPEDCPEHTMVDMLSDAGKCSVSQADGCSLSFQIIAPDKDVDENVTMLIQKTLICAEPVDILPIAAGVIGGVVAIGILLLFLWKILTTLFDRIEYSKFQEDLKRCKWAQQDNPFYTAATRTYKNPMLDPSTAPETEEKS